MEVNLQFLDKVSKLADSRFWYVFDYRESNFESWIICSHICFHTIVFEIGKWLVDLQPDEKLARRNLHILVGVEFFNYLPKYLIGTSKGY